MLFERKDVPTIVLCFPMHPQIQLRISEIVSGHYAQCIPGFPRAPVVGAVVVVIAFFILCSGGMMTGTAAPTMWTTTEVRPGPPATARGANRSERVARTVATRARCKRWLRGLLFLVQRWSMALPVSSQCSPSVSFAQRAEFRLHRNRSLPVSFAVPPSPPALPAPLPKTENTSHTCFSGPGVCPP